ncbi:hypothetical protein J2Z49_001703 [Desulfofundulus luciae]|uniref:CobQ/CobB/MinD/ParA nucleotide binding domain-containing protein n=1 Tax=Desulfofundulus luciae TaxID=74702 RepID=A0ABU0B1I1_9FIRM|nr:hypothetical protein [Desulfofundulus luciae]MDQ0286589.1 hypothetical protein [Desulfofundulus luciae]
MSRGLRRITIFTGHLGSGKTELAINFALSLKERGLPTSVIDLDVVNPYFRTRLVRQKLEQMGLTVVCPRGEWMRADLPALPPAIRGVLEDPDRYGVFDVGGDEVGATVLGRYKPLLPAKDYHLWLVVNTCRPFTRDKEGIINMLESIEKACRLQVTGLVSNTNLGAATGWETILAGHRVVQDAARVLNLPVVMVAARRELAEHLRAHLPPGLPVLPLNLFMQTPWQDF